MGDKVAELQGEIERGVADLVAGEDWQRWLRVASRFSRHSFRNTLLILRQRPQASVVMGYRAWQALGHQVRQGERSITILAPCTYRRARQDDADDQDDERGRVLRGFRPAHVFDVSQTEGDTVAPPARPTLLEGEAPDGLWDTLAAQVVGEGFALTRGELENGANGRTDFAGGTVTVESSLSPAQAAKTLAHELGHVLLHREAVGARIGRGRAEVEAESVAYVVCQAAGLTTAAYSFGYVAGWSGGNPEVVKETAGRVVGCSRQILLHAGLLAPTPYGEPTVVTAA